MTESVLDVTLLTAGSCTHRAGIARRGARGTATFPSLVAVVRHREHGAVLFDTGYTPRFLTETAWFPSSLYRRATPVRCDPRETVAAQLAGLGLTPADVRLVVVSHLHADHVAGLRDFPDARVVAGQGAVPALRSARGLGRVRKGLLPGLLPDDLDARLLEVPAGPADAAATRGPDRVADPQADGTPLGDLGPASDLLGDGSVVAVPLPGHHPGHLGLWLPSAGPDGLLLVGDACWSVRAVTHDELPHPVVRLVTHDWRAYHRTVRELQRLHRTRPQLLVVPSHCPEAIDAARAALDAARPGDRGAAS